MKRKIRNMPTTQKRKIYKITHRYDLATYSTPIFLKSKLSKDLFIKLTIWLLEKAISLDQQQEPSTENIAELIIKYYGAKKIRWNRYLKNIQTVDLYQSHCDWFSNDLKMQLYYDQKFYRYGICLALYTVLRNQDYVEFAAGSNKIDGATYDLLQRDILKLNKEYTA